MYPIFDIFEPILNGIYPTYDIFEPIFKKLGRKSNPNYSQFSPKISILKREVIPPTIISERIILEE